MMTNIKRRTSKQIKHTINGFTIIELLVVIVVIGILATIGAVSYNGVQSKAADTSVLSDLDTMEAIQAGYAMRNNGIPKAYYSGSGPDASLEFTPSSGNYIDVVIDGTDYCIRGYNTVSAKKSINDAYIRESNIGVCSQINPSAVSQSKTPITSIGSISTNFGTNVGSTLTAGTLTPSGTATYKWQRSYTPAGSYSYISGATSNKYILTVGDIGKYIRVKATGSGSYADSVFSAPSNVVVAGNPDWIIGVDTMLGKYVYYKDAGAPSTYTYANRNTGCVDGGRAPSKTELEAISTASDINRNTPYGVFAETKYWTSTGYMSYVDTSWYVVFGKGWGYISSYMLNTNLANIRCVKG